MLRQLNQEQADPFMRPIDLFAPNGPAAIFVATGAILQLTLLHYTSDGILGTGPGAWLDVLLVALFVWSSIAWGLWCAARARRSLAKHLHPRLALLLDGTIYFALGTATLAYVISWGMFLRTGRFASIESIEFFLVNAGASCLDEYLLQSEWLHSVIVLAAGLPVIIGTAFVFRCMGETQRAVFPRLRRFNLLGVGRVCVWCLLLVAVLIAFGHRIRDMSSMRRGIWRCAVREQLDPIITLTCGLYSRLQMPPIEPSLDTSQLVALEQSTSVVPKTTAESPSVVFVAIESLRHDVVHLEHQGRKVMPNLSRLASGGLLFSRAYSQSTHSDYSDVCIVSSLYPLRTVLHHYYRRTDPWPKTLICDVLKPAGYGTANISSQNERWGGMDNFLVTDNLDLFYDAERSTAPTRLDERDKGFAHEVKMGPLRAGKLDDSHTTDRAIAWIEGQVSQKSPLFLNINYQSSHFPYAMDPDVPRPFQPATIDFDASFAWYPEDKVPIVRNAYYNAIHECDRQLGRLVEVLARLDRLDNTILVVLGENGEAFHENGAICHARHPAEPTIHVALVMHAPKLLRPSIEDYPTELVDVVPTVLSLIGIDPHPNFQGIDVLSPDRPRLNERLLFFHTENPLSRTDALLFQGRWKLIHDRNTNNYQLFDIVSDPGEQRNLFQRRQALASGLQETLRDWRTQQLAYYYYPQYYLFYYPPKPPKFKQPFTLSRRSGELQAAH